MNNQTKVSNMVEIEPWEKLNILEFYDLKRNIHFYEIEKEISKIQGGVCLN